MLSKFSIHLKKSTLFKVNFLTVGDYNPTFNEKFSNVQYSSIHIVLLQLWGMINIISHNI